MIEDFFDEDENTSWIHDDDSDRPNSIIDWEPEPEDDDDDNQYLDELIEETIQELERATETAHLVDNLTLPSTTVLRALNLIKAFYNLTSLTVADYEDE